jgi:hypothetical protein
LLAHPLLLPLLRVKFPTIADFPTSEPSMNVPNAALVGIWKPKGVGRHVPVGTHLRVNRESRKR